eukprot:TRINITY_DN23244_c0_g1_i1.p1 TRINITY_DN23244_c0_g1~~TRINITY_DN23244_c0_g1_i1.p1  ORF type:complete len:278 (+),score=45.25 TRINITY_DN23244_c0_g1_i1:114-947(+)
MGICASIPDVPDVIIPDPEGGKEHIFALSAAARFSDNFKVHKDSKDGGLWLFIRRRGDAFSEAGKNDGAYDLQNFVRPEDSNDGACLCYAYCGKRKFKQRDTEEEKDSDDSDGYSASDSDGEGEVVKQKTKWVFKGELEFYTDRTKSKKLGSLTLKAKGVSKRKCQWVDEPAPHVRTLELEKKTKKMFYKFELNGTSIPIEIEGKLNKGPDKLTYKSPLFVAENTKGQPRPVVRTTDACDTPEKVAFALLAGFVVCNEAEPRDLASEVSVHFPNPER